MLNPQNRLLCGVLFLGLLVLDQISKTWVVGTLDLGERVDVTSFFRCFRSCTTGFRVAHS